MEGDGVGVGPFIKQVVKGWRPTCGSLPFYYLLYKRTHPYPVSLLPFGLSYFQAKPSPVWIPQLFSTLVIIYLLAYEDETECSETSAYKIQTPGNYPEENIQRNLYCLRTDSVGLCVMLLRYRFSGPVRYIRRYGFCSPTRYMLYAARNSSRYIQCCMNQTQFFRI